MSPPNVEGYVSLPRGLHVRVAVAPDARPLEAIVRAVDAGRLTLGVLDLPSSAETLRGTRASIAAQLHGRVYELHASILDIDATPPALVLTLPVEARRTERRDFYRLNVSIEVRASWQDDPDDALHPARAARLHELPGARLLDISGGGALLRTRDRVPIDARLQLAFALDPEAPPIELQARVRSLRQEERAHAYRINTEFEGIARRTQERIVRFIFQQQSLLSRRRST